LETNGKKLMLGILIISAIFGGLVYNEYHKKSNNVEEILGPPSYIPGPNASSEECQNLSKEWGSMLNRQVIEDGRAEDRDTAKFEQLERAQMPEAQRETALSRLSAEQDIAKTEREGRQKNEEISLRERERAAGCQQLNPQLPQ